MLRNVFSGANGNFDIDFKTAEEVKFTQLTDAIASPQNTTHSKEAITLAPGLPGCPARWNLKMTAMKEQRRQSSFSGA